MYTLHTGITWIKKPYFNCVCNLHSFYTVSLVNLVIHLIYVTKKIKHCIFYTTLIINTIKSYNLNQNYKRINASSSLKN